MDQKLTQLLSDIQGLERWNKALRMVAGRVQSAAHDLHFALSAGDVSPARSSQVIYRQTLALMAQCENFETLIRYIFDERQSLKVWTGQIGNVRRDLVAFQKLQQDKKPRADQKTQFVIADQDWEKLVAQLKNLPGDQYLLFQASAAQVDQTFHRLATQFEVKDRRAPLPNRLLQ